MNIGNIHLIYWDWNGNLRCCLVSHREPDRGTEPHDWKVGWQTESDPWTLVLFQTHQKHRKIWNKNSLGRPCWSYPLKNSYTVLGWDNLPDNTKTPIAHTAFLHFRLMAQTTPLFWDGNAWRFRHSMKNTNASSYFLHPQRSLGSIRLKIGSDPILPSGPETQKRQLRPAIPLCGGSPSREGDEWWQAWRTGRITTGHE